MAVMQLWAAVFITYGVTTGIAQTFRLDMAPESVDDMYEGCSDKMNAKANVYLQNETKMNINFSEAWELSEEAWKKYEQKTSLEKDLFKAIYVYTLVYPEIYPDLNNAVRSQRCQYNTTFRYHALHFFLTRAIQTLNAGKRKGKCLTSYRRTNVSFSKVVLNKEFRFGSFTSSSKKYYPSENFGKVSCFKIFTCFGADIQEYSSLKHEREVLIPPYEIFKVKRITMGKERNKKQSCNVIYEVKSTGTSSNLNCALFHKRGIRTNKFYPQ